MGGQQAQPTGNPAGRSLAIPIVGCLIGPLLLQIAVANAIDGEAAIPRKEELLAVLGTDRPPGTVTGTCTGARLADRIQGSASGDGKHRETQRLQISALGRQAR